MLTNYKSHFCTSWKIIAILQCTFYHSLCRKQVYRSPNTHIEASLPYISIEARPDSLHFLTDCKKNNHCYNVSHKLIKAFYTVTVAFSWYFDIADCLFLLCLHNNVMYIMPYHWDITQMCGCLKQLNTKSGLHLYWNLIAMFVCFVLFLACGVFSSELKNLEIRMDEGRRQNAY